MGSDAATYWERGAETKYAHREFHFLVNLVEESKNPRTEELLYPHD